MHNRVDKTKVYNIDCLIGMKEFPDKYFELAIVDPPYGLNEDSHRQNERRSNLAKSKRYHDSVWKQSAPNEDYFRELHRISINMIVWGANHFIISKVDGRSFIETLPATTRSFAYAIAKLIICTRGSGAGLPPPPGLNSD